MTPAERIDKIAALEEWQSSFRQVQVGTAVVCSIAVFLRSAGFAVAAALFYTVLLLAHYLVESSIRRHNRILNRR